MEMAFRDVKWNGSIITAECEHNRGEHTFSIKIEGVIPTGKSKDLKLITDPPEYTKKFAMKGAVFLLHEVLRTGQDYIDETGYIYAMGR